MRKTFILLSVSMILSTIWGINHDTLNTKNEVVGKSPLVMSLQELKEYFSQLSVTQREVCQYILNSVNSNPREENFHNKEKQACSGTNNQDLNQNPFMASYNLGRSLLHDKVFQENQDILNLLISYKNKKPISTDKLNVPCQRLTHDPFGSIVNFIKIGSEEYPLHRACKKNNVIIVKWLVELGADINWRNIRTCRTPLFGACKLGNKSIVEYLLEHNAVVNVKDYKNEIPLFGACKNGHEEIVKLLIEHGVDVNKENNFGETPLFAACENGHEKIVKLLIEHGADLNKENNFRETPLQVARRNDNENIAKYLIKRGAKEYFVYKNFGWLFSPQQFLMQNLTYDTSARE